MRLADVFRHIALLYAGRDDFLERTYPFVREGVERHEPVLVVVDPPKINLLRNALGADHDRVCFADMAVVGHNPGRLIETWHRFLTERRVENEHQPVRGIGEPVGPARSPAALAECNTHEALLNRAFATAGAFSLMCPYDTAALASNVVEDALRNHPIVADHDGEHESATFVPSTRFDEPLPPSPAHATVCDFDRRTMASMRKVISERAAAHGIEKSRTDDFLVAVNEAATNSVVHGGGAGSLSMWSDGDNLVCEVRDRGFIDEPLVGRLRPALDAPSGYGLWLANQLCDLVQIRSSGNGTVVRLHMARAAPAWHD